MIFAQIKNNIVQNTIVLKDDSLLPLFNNDPQGDPYDYVLQIDLQYPQPGIGWTFDGIKFFAPNIGTNIDEDNTQIDFQESVTSTSLINAPVSSDALMTNMSLQPGEGNYIVLFSCSVSSNIAGAQIDFSIYTNGIQDEGSIRNTIPYDGGSTPPGIEIVSINQSLTVNDGEAIEIWWSTSDDGPTATSRTLTILRV